MLRIAALYDIHGNLPALEAVLGEVRELGVDQIVVGGDVLPGPMPRECRALLDSTGIPTRFIHGNGESAALEALGGGSLDSVPEAFREWIRWSGQQLTGDQVAATREWPLTTRLEIDGIGSSVFCHATTRNDTEIFTRLSPDEHVRTLFAGVDAALVVCGHTHMQFDRTVGPLRLVNAGSIGMPFGAPGAYWLFLGPDVQLRRTSYDLDSATARILATAYPGAEVFATRMRLPVPENVILESYARTDGRGV